MKLYKSIGPNPRVVRMFLAEKGVTLDEIEVDLRGGENRQAPYNVEVNPAGQTPALQMDDGSCLAEITAICEYLEERHPSPPLIGSTPEERAATRMWTRRVDLKICEPMANGFRYAEGLPLFKDRLRCLPEAADGLKAVAKDGEAWMESQFKGPWIARRPLHARRHPAVRLHRVRRGGGPAPGPGLHPAHGLVRPGARTAQRGGQRLNSSGPLDTEGLQVFFNPG